MDVWVRISRAGATVALVAGIAVMAAGTASARTSSGPCGELPSSLRSLCAGPGVHCTVHPDAHKHWETVFGTEPTMSQAGTIEKRAVAKGFGPLAIEADTRCSNGKGVYEVARARFTSFAGAGALVAKAKAKGFSGARSEDS